MAAIGGYAYFVEYKGGEKKEQIKKEKSKLFQVSNFEEVNRIILTWAAARTVLVKENGVWKLVEPVSDRSDKTVVETLLTALKEEEASGTVVEGENLDLAKFGLKDPLGSVEVLLQQGPGFKIDFGTVDGMGGIKYVHIPSQKRIVTVPSFVQVKFQKTARDLREKKLFLTAPDQVAEVQIDADEHTTIVKSDAGWRYKEKSWPVDQGKAAAYLQELSLLTAEDVVSESKSDKEVIKKYLSGKPTAKITLTKGDGTKVGLISYAVKDAKAYVTMDDRPQVYQLVANNIENVKIKQMHFRDKKAPFKFDLSGIQEMDIRTGSSKINIKKNHGMWEQNPKVDGKSISFSKIENMITTLHGLEVLEFPKAVKGQILGSVVMKGADGKVVFQFDLGREQGKEGRIVTTNLSPDVLLINKNLISSIDLSNLYEEVPKKAGEVQVKEVAAPSKPEEKK
jgi:hypothetical protein